SQLADRFVKDPHEVVRNGQVVKVRVTEVDVARKRIGLSMRQDRSEGEQSARSAKKPTGGPKKPGSKTRKSRGSPSSNPETGAFGAALKEAYRKR
ncbi:MAG: S1 RNA-binding domain-containing protein, partial [Pseudomonadota bacterium]